MRGTFGIVTIAAGSSLLAAEALASQGPGVRPGSASMFAELAAGSIIAGLVLFVAVGVARFYFGR